MTSKKVLLVLGLAALALLTVDARTPRMLRGASRRLQGRAGWKEDDCTPDTCQPCKPNANLCASPKSKQSPCPPSPCPSPVPSPCSASPCPTTKECKDVKPCHDECEDDHDECHHDCDDDCCDGSYSCYHCHDEEDDCEDNHHHADAGSAGNIVAKYDGNTMFDLNKLKKELNSGSQQNTNKRVYDWDSLVSTDRLKTIYENQERQANQHY